MPLLLSCLVFLPAIGFLLSLFVARGNEKLLSALVITVTGLHLLLGVVFMVVWWVGGHAVLDVKSLLLYQSHDFEFFLDFYYDNVTAVFSLVGSSLTLMVAVFSRYYMHREPGFKRYFCAVMLFFTGYNFVVFSGNLETLFLGWELLGLTSFLLIAFYRDRYLPVKNGFKVLSYYRLSDVCLVLAMWMSHHLWHKNITYSQWNQVEALQEHLQAHPAQVVFIAMMILIAATLKSAQAPFFTWLPRAMEGPTTSSAIFYGALSVHIGVFLLLRTYPLWESLIMVKVLVVVIGAVSTLIASSIARVQATVKTQIAYASVAQIGLMFIEVAFNFQVLALIHFAGNAFLRTYQLLVSPSVLSYRIHDMFFNFIPTASQNKDGVMERIKAQLYLLSVKEWNFDFFLHRYLWSPLKWVGHQLNYQQRQGSLMVYSVLIFAGIITHFFRQNIADHWVESIPILSIVLALMLLLMAFSSRGDAQRVWVNIVLSQVCFTLAILWNSAVDGQRVVIYLSGTFAGAVLGYYCLHKLKKQEGDVRLHDYHGYAADHPRYAQIFLLSCLSLVGFPLTPTFVGMDLMFMSIAPGQPLLIALVALNFLLLELTILRVYVRIFLGQDKKNNHPVAYKSS
ncbi:MAG: hypothetical protein RIQ78_77 [Bacteroidota bacterium]